MTKKDFTATENKDREQNASEDWHLHHDETKRFPAEAKGIGEVSTGEDVKNAHATGDGSFGRADGSLTDKEEEKPNGEGSY